MPVEGRSGVYSSHFHRVAPDIHVECQDTAGDVTIEIGYSAPGILPHSAGAWFFRRGKREEIIRQFSDLVASIQQEIERLKDNGTREELLKRTENLLQTEKRIAQKEKEESLRRSPGVTRSPEYLKGVEALNVSQPNILSPNGAKRAEEKPLFP